MNDKYEAIIGLEVHAQLLTESKIFCACRNVYGAEPNTQTCPVCLGLPGTLPVLNKKAVEFALRMGLATECKIRPFSRFARKNYFYPDLPKGYQISQYDEPLCDDGRLKIRCEGTEKIIGITRIHLEEDAGKSIHGMDDTLVDFNRCGVPLIEIVSAPDLRSPAEAYAYLMKLKQTLEYLEICDCNMEQGSLRCDANISLRLRGANRFGTKTEMKNMNSFRGVERALKFEIERQAAVLDAGGTILQQTLLWDESNGVARPMRTKEEANDYRYFPEPDLVPLKIDEQWIREVRDKLPELPDAKFKRFVTEYKLRDYDADLLSSDRHLAAYFEAVNQLVNDPPLVSKWIQGEVLRILTQNEIRITEFPLSPERLAGLLTIVKGGKVTTNVGKEILERMLKNDKTAEAIAVEEKLIQVSDSGAIEKVIRAVLAENPNELERYHAGKQTLFAFFMGQVMKKTQGKANPEVTSKVLKQLLEE